jgi:GntR family transcriptional repressor for pyruvate dehydrogenase complex
MRRRRTVVPFRPPARRRVHESVAEQLRDAILDGRLRVGQKLPPERELAAKFEVNRTSVREAIKVLEGLKLVSVRQGDGATVLPLSEASLSILPAMIYHGGRLDTAALAEVAEVINPLFFEMARLGIERARPAHLTALRALRTVVADEARDREERFEAGRQVFVLVSEMSGNRVWQMLAHRVRDFLRSEPMRQTRHALRRDPGQIVPTIDRCLAAMEAGHPEEALAALRSYIAAVGDAIMSLKVARGRAEATGGNAR